MTGKKERGKPRWGLWLFLALLAVGGTWLAMIFFGPVSQVPTGTSLRYDDFEFTVNGAAAMKQIATHRPPEGKKFVVFDVRVKNLAKRVSFTFKPEMIEPFVQGARLERASDQQSTLDTLVNAIGKSPKPTLAPGQSETYRTAFIAPSDASHCEVKIRMTGSFFSLLDTVKHGNKAVLVNIAEP